MKTRFNLLVEILGILKTNNIKVSGCDSFYSSAKKIVDECSNEKIESIKFIVSQSNSKEIDLLII